MSENAEVQPEHEIAQVRVLELRHLHKIVLPDDVAVLHREADQNPIADSAEGSRDHVLVCDG